MQPDPLDRLDRPDSTPEWRRLLEISDNQVARHAVADAAVVWQGAALAPGQTFGRPGSVPVGLSVTDDGLLHCRTVGGARVWSVSLRAPNTCQVKRGAVWITRIDDSEAGLTDGRRHLLLAHLTRPGDVAVPYLGLLAAGRARRASRSLRTILESVGARVG